MRDIFDDVFDIDDNGELDVLEKTAEYMFIDDIFFDEDDEDDEEDF